MPSVSESILRHPSGAKSGSASKRLTTMKGRKVDSTSKMAYGHVPPAAEKKESARGNNCEKSTKPASKEFLDICALLRLDLLKDVEACAKFVMALEKSSIRVPLLII